AMRRSTPQRKYLLLCGGLFLMSACPLTTFYWLSQSIDRPPAPAVVAASPAGVQTVEQLRTQTTGTEDSSRLEMVERRQEPLPKTDVLSKPFREHVPRTRRWRDAVGLTLPWLVAGWLTGVLMLSLRLLSGWRQVQRMQRHGTTPAPSFCQDCLSR